MDAPQTPGQNFQPPQGSNFAGGPPPGAGGFRGGRGGMMFLGPYGGIVTTVLLVLTYVVMAIAMWQFLRKSGLTPWIAILMLVPVVNLGVALWVAFTRWPILAEVERLKMALATSALVNPSATSQDGDAVSADA